LLISVAEDVYVGLLPGNKVVVYNVTESTKKSFTARTMCLVGNILALGLPLGNIDLICVSTWSKIGVIQTPVVDLCTVNSDTIAAYDNDVTLWNVHTGDCIAVLQGCPSRIISLTLVSSDLLVSLNANNEVDLWSTETHQWLGTIGNEHNAQASAVCGV
jgi:WD40 repeat protein